MEGKDGGVNIFEWDYSTNKFKTNQNGSMEPIQKIFLNASDEITYGVSLFKMHETQSYYLGAIFSSIGDERNNVTQPLFVWNQTSKQFDFFQMLPGDGGSLTLNTFNYNNQTYLFRCTWRSMFHSLYSFFSLFFFWFLKMWACCFVAGLLLIDCLSAKKKVQTNKKNTQKLK